MSDQWYYVVGGQQAQQGPATVEALEAMIRQGQLASGDLVWRDGMQTWLPAAQVRELANAFAATIPTHPIAYARPYQPQYQSYPQGSVPNYLVQSILVTIFCCWPFGIPAIVYAAQVNGKLGQGDYQGALIASKNAKTWTWVSFGLGLMAVLFYVIAAIIGAANS